MSVFCLASDKSHSVNECWQEIKQLDTKILLWNRDLIHLTSFTAYNIYLFLREHIDK